MSKCPLGTYSVSGAGTCTLCPAGTYGATQAQASAACSGNCSAGYTCPPGSDSPTAVACGPGQYSVGGSVVCTLCPPGTFGSASALPSATCSGLCRWGGGTAMRATCGLVHASLLLAGRLRDMFASRYLTPRPLLLPCSHATNSSYSAGYACPAGSANSTVFQCPTGTYAGPGSPQCYVCPPNRPYTPVGAVSADWCSACNSSCNTSYGRFPCPDALVDAALWYDAGRVEGGVNSCLKGVWTEVDWVTANSSCGALGAGAHLLTSLQVRGEGCPPPAPLPLLPSTLPGSFLDALCRGCLPLLLSHPRTHTHPRSRYVCPPCVW
jgi:hypothetical protein